MYLDVECFPKNIHSNCILLMSHYLNNVIAIYLTEFAFCSLYCCGIYIFRYSLILEQSVENVYFIIFRAGLFVCASAHSGELSCWEIQMSHSVFRFPAPYLFPMRKPWIKDLCPIGPKPLAPPLCIFGCFCLETKERKSFLLNEVLKINL